MNTEIKAQSTTHHGVTGIIYNEKKLGETSNFSKSEGFLTVDVHSGAFAQSASSGEADGAEHSGKILSGVFQEELCRALGWSLCSQAVAFAPGGSWHAHPRSSK